MQGEERKRACPILGVAQARRGVNRAAPTVVRVSGRAVAMDSEVAGKDEKRQTGDRRRGDGTTDGKADNNSDPVNQEEEQELERERERERVKVRVRASERQ